MMQKPLLFVALALAASLAACTPKSDIVIQNPISAGAVPPSKIVQGARYAEDQAGLEPGTLDDEATIASLDAKEACFDLIFRVTSDATLKFKRLTASLTVKGGGVLIPSQISPNPAKVTQQDGIIQRRVVLDGIVHTLQEKGQIEVREESGKICFTNGGAINEATPQVTLDILQDEHRVRKFRWGFKASK